MLVDHIVAALNACGLDATEEAVAALTRVVEVETGGRPELYEVSDQVFTVYGGGWKHDPVAELVATISYMLARYGKIVDHSELDVDATGHLGVVSEVGPDKNYPWGSENAANG